MFKKEGERGYGFNSQLIKTNNYRS